MSNTRVFDSSLYRQGSIAAFPGGVVLSSPMVKPAQRPSCLDGVKRGTIGGWSYGSRRRMREFLLTHDAPGIDLCGVTLTLPIPSWSVTPIQAKECFKRFCRASSKQGGCAVWRIEIQKRGSLHWHMLAGMSGNPSDFEDRIKGLWYDALRRIGPVPVTVEGCENPHYLWEVHEDKGLVYYTIVRQEDKPLKGQCSVDDWPVLLDGMGVDLGDLPAPVTGWADVSLWPGARLHAVDVIPDSGADNWARYLLDHTTKAKQEQIPENIGRHWGVIGRKHFAEILPASVAALSPGEYSRVRRWYERLCRSSRPNPEAPFGRSLGFKIRRGRRGRSVCFCRSDTIERMIQHARKGA